MPPRTKRAPRTQPPDRYRQLFEQSIAVQLVVTQTGSIVEANQAAADFYGLTRPQLAEMALAELAPGDPTALDDALEVATAIGMHVTGVPHRHASGETRLVEVYGSPLAGDRPLVHITVHDITERSRTEQQARLLLAERVAKGISERAAHEWQGTFDAIEQPIAVVDAERRIRRANAALARLANTSAEGLGHQRIESLGDDALWSTAARHVGVTLRHGSIGVARVTDSRKRTWEVATTRFVPPGESDLLAIVVLRELTALIALQDELQRQETMSRMGELVAGVAHEVRNPLFALSSSIDALKRRLGDQADFARYAPIIDSQVERLSALMRDLLDYGKPTALTPRETPVAELLSLTAELAQPLASSSGVRVETSLDGDPAQSARLDRHRFLQVLHNLVANAIQHSPAGGRVALRASRHTDPDGSHWVRFEVTDQGPGFERDALPRVFEPFFTRRHGGTGLGLALAHRTVHDHGGQIAAENRVGPDGAIVGAQLTVRIPSGQQGGST
jgi:PAS domain S-box-containing protein